MWALWFDAGIEFSTAAAAVARRSILDVYICICKAISWSVSQRFWHTGLRSLLLSSVCVEMRSGTSRQTKLQEHVSKVSIRESDSAPPFDSLYLSIFFGLFLYISSLFFLFSFLFNFVCRQRGKLFLSLSLSGIESRVLIIIDDGHAPTLFSDYDVAVGVFYFSIFKRGCNWRRKREREKGEGKRLARKEPSIIRAQVGLVAIFSSLFFLVILSTHLWCSFTPNIKTPSSTKHLSPLKTAENHFKMAQPRNQFSFGLSYRSDKVDIYLSTSELNATNKNT